MRKFSIAIMLSGLGACGPDGEFAKEQGEVQIEAVSNNEVPIDGSIHVVKRGIFLIARDTRQCISEAVVAPSLRDLDLRFAGIEMQPVYQVLRQPEYINGSPRIAVIGKNCRDATDINVQWRVELNPASKPYRLTLVVRQGDAFWQGIVERDGKRPDSSALEHPPALGDGPCCEPAISIQRDRVDLSAHFISAIIGNKND